MDEGTNDEILFSNRCLFCVKSKCSKTKLADSINVQKKKSMNQNQVILIALSYSSCVKN